MSEQLADFGMGIYSPEELIRDVAARYREIEAHEVLDALSNPAVVLSATAAQWEGRIRAYHDVLYRDVLSWAGAYRSAGDPWKGAVRYGGTSTRTMDDKFEGVTPDRIGEAVIEAFSHLDGRHADPFFAIAVAYQRFVFTHPFYDANGRIGRLVMTRWLVAHGWLPDWGRFAAAEGEWHTRLNKVHASWRRGGMSYVSGVTRFIRDRCDRIWTDDGPMGEANPE